MKNLLYFFFIFAGLSANGQNADLIVKTDLDSIECSIKSIVGIGAKNGAIKFSTIENPDQFFGIHKQEVFYIQNALSDKDNSTSKPEFFNTDFNYSEAYFLKTGQRPKPDDYFLTVTDGPIVANSGNESVQNSKDNINGEMWRYEAGKQLNTSGSLLLGGIGLAVLGTLFNLNDVNPTLGYAFIGAGGISMIAGYSFLIAAGNTMRRP